MPNIIQGVWEAIAQLKAAGLSILLVDGGNAASLGRTDYDDILTNFSPIMVRKSQFHDRLAAPRP